MLQHWVFYGDISDGRLEQFFCSTLKNLRRFSVQDQTNRDTLTLWNLEFRFTRQPDVDDQMWAVVAGSRDVNGSTAHFIYWCSCTLSSTIFVEIPSMLGYSATHNLRPMCPVHNRVETKAKTTHFHHVAAVCYFGSPRNFKPHHERFIAQTCSFFLGAMYF